MRAISLWQPWASLIMTGAKTFETRHWSTSYRGPLVIHAAKGGLAKWEERDLIECTAFGQCWKFQGGLAPLIGKPLNLGLELNHNHEWPGVRITDLPRGVALGVVNLVDCIPTARLQQGQIEPERWFGDFSLGRFAWKLENARPFVDPIPIAGKQGFFDVTVNELSL